MGKSAYPTEWLRPTVLEMAEANPSWTAQQIAAQLERFEPEYAQPSVAEVQAVLDTRPVLPQ